MLKELTPNQVLGDVMTQETYRGERDGVDQDEKKYEDKKRKSVAFKASSSKSKGKAKKEESSEDEEVSDIDDEALALFVRKFGKFMKKKGCGVRKRRDQNKSKEYVRRCHKCKSKDHIVADCPYNSDNDEDDKKKENKVKKEKKMTFHKNKGGGYVVTWDSDASLDIDDSSDDDKKSKKKALVNITINNKPSFFDIPSTCLMAKPIKVQYDESDDDCKSDNCKSDGDDVDDDKESKEELMDMLENAHTCLEMKRMECKELQKELKALKQSFDELQESHEILKEDHEELGNAHSKLEKAHSSLLKQAKKEEVIVTCDKGSTCDLINESFIEPIILAFTNSSCSTSTSTSYTSDGFTCDATLIVENETLKKEVNELTRALGNAYGGEAHLLKCLGS